ncbi:2-hydroxychromene-2-carboxylate isomerase, partial [Streptococcus pyogenes]|uniref:2-hydroxychromene-2-carboxylate isomerase n=1 Tax=Streptococcus pyogenes TaxID=1314 RepID=UPI003DA18236
KSLGWASSPFVVQKEKGAYVWLDMARECARYGVPWKMPTTFPRGSVLGHRLAIAAAGEPWLEAYCRAMFLRNFAHDQEIEGVDAASAALASIGQHSGIWIERATSEEVKLRLRNQTEEAREKGIFGAPTFFVGTEMFWGNDRLEQALERARTVK